MNVNDKAALTVAIDEFDEFFAAVNHGREPYAWQRALLRQVVTTGRWPDAVVAPTGAGKSSVLEVHVFAVAMTHAPGWEGARAPSHPGAWVMATAKTCTSKTLDLPAPVGATTASGQRPVVTTCLSRARCQA